MKYYVVLLSLLLIQPSIQKSLSAAPGCRKDYKATKSACSKFDFITKPEAIKKGCINPTNGTTFYDLSAYPAVTQVSSNVAKIASLITNVFEEGDTSFAYAQSSDIGDSRGYTSGYVGFTTGTGDAEILIKLYEKIKPNNSLSKYLPKLHEISQLPTCDRPNRGKVNGLEGFAQAWKKEACTEDQSFSKLQREWVYDNYLVPSARYAAEYGVVSALGRAIFYDTIIQHGYQYVEPDINIVRILTLVGSRRSDESEEEFLTRFLTVRGQLQCCYPDKVWNDSATRTEDLQALVDEFDDNKDLLRPFELHNFGVKISGKESLDKKDSRCTSSTKA
ncbi:lysozyme-like domain-containing protein [Sporodiniella umbellata]|nr:lysozyme-like domain-containing protein [Sporodiniella umbellata]